MFRCETRNLNKLTTEFLKEAGIDMPVNPSKSHPRAVGKKEKKIKKQIQKALDKSNQPANQNHDQQPTSAPNAEKSASELSNQKVDEDHSSVAITFVETKPNDYPNESTVNGRQGQYCFKNQFKAAGFFEINNEGIFTGYFGHGTAILKDPIVEGNYYFQFEVLPQKNPPFEIKYESSVRVGLCPYKYHLGYPLGRDSSMSYNSSSGNIVYGEQMIANEIKYGQGDIIGMAVKIAPPHKHRKIESIDKHSCVTFFKNGKQVDWAFRKLKQESYHIGISLFNYAKVKVNKAATGIIFDGDKYESFTNIGKDGHCLYKEIEFLRRISKAASSLD